MSWAPRPLPEHLMMRGGDPNLVGKELLQIIRDDIVNQPRSLQKRIGPSEIGQACARRIGYKLMGAPDFNAGQAVPWKAYIGTAMHTQLEHVFGTWDHRQALANPGGYEPRWYTESKVTVGQIGEDDIDGHTDLYDRVTCTAIDWKLVGPSPLKAYRAKGPGPQYRSQAHLYGRGWQHHGLPVDTVMIVFLPRNDELSTTHVWFEPYDERVAIAALDRANAIQQATVALGIEALARLPTAPSYCYRCPYHKARSSSPLDGCPGDPGEQPHTAPPALTLTPSNPPGR